MPDQGSDQDSRDRDSVSTPPETSASPRHARDRLTTTTRREPLHDPPPANRRDDRGCDRVEVDPASGMRHRRPRGVHPLAARSGRDRRRCRRRGEPRCRIAGRLRHGRRPWPLKRLDSGGDLRLPREDHPKPRDVRVDSDVGEHWQLTPQGRAPPPPRVPVVVFQSWTGIDFGFRAIPRPLKGQVSPTRPTQRSDPGPPIAVRHRSCPPNPPATRLAQVPTAICPPRQASAP